MKKVKKEKKEERQRKKKIEIEKERIKVLTRKAKAFYTQQLQRNALNRWKKLIKDRTLNEYLADKHYETFIKTKCLKDWVHMVKSNQIMRRVRAEELQKQQLMLPSGVTTLCQEPRCGGGAGLAQGATAACQRAPPRLQPALHHPVCSRPRATMSTRGWGMWAL